MKKELNLLLIMSVVLIMISCSTKYVPLETTGITVSDDFAILKTKDYTFAVENKYWIKDPQDITDYFTTFYVTIKNKNQEKMEISPSDIGLLDEDGNQFDVVDLKYIEDMLLPEQLKYLVLTNIEDETSDVESLLEDQKNILEDWREAKKNLITYSFHFGSILPNAQKSGFIFFPRLSSRNDFCQIVFRNTQIKFIRNNIKKKEKKN